MSAEATVHPQSTLEIHGVARLQVTQIGAGKTFLEQIEHELFLAMRCHGKAAAIDGYTFPDTHSRSRARRTHEELHRFVGAS